MNALRTALGWLYGLQVLLVVPWFLGAFYRGEQSPWPWREFSKRLDSHGLNDALLCLYLYVIFYSFPVVVAYLIIGWSRSRLPEASQARGDSKASRLVLALWVGYSVFLILPASLEFFRHLPFGLLRGSLFGAWIVLSIIAFPVIRRGLNDFLG